MAEERYGIETFFDTKEFAKGLDQYLKGLGQATQATTGAASAIGQQGMAGGLSALDIGLAAATGGVSALATVVGTKLLDSFQSLTSLVNDATDTLISFGTESLQIAGKVDELQRSALYLGQQAGYTNDQMLDFFDALETTGIRADVSGQLLSQLARYNIDLANAVDLANVAQNAGILVGRDSSDVLESLTQAAVTNQVVVARNAGIIVNFTDAQEKLAKELGKSREQLTASEKTQANFNAILEEGAKISGVYGVAMGSPTKALRSLGREIYNLQAALGAPFLDAWATVVDIIRGFVQDLTAAVSEGGSLYPVLVNIGAAASLMADGLKIGAEAVSNFIFSLVDRFGSSFDQLAYNALYAGSEIIAQFATGMVNTIAPVLNALWTVEKWLVDEFGDDAIAAFNFGVEIVVNLAEGIIEAASTVLITAMEFIGSILTSWLAPGSPPKVAPDLDKWGAQAMAEYLKGFAEADFDVLERLQSAFQGALGPEGLAGVMDELLTAVNVGKLSDELFAQLAQQSGEYGNELATLTRLELDYAAAIERVNKASENLIVSQDDVAKATAEYNDLLRQGADEETLRAKLEEINAAEKRVEVAQNEARAAAKSVDQIEDQTQAQRDLIAQLNKFFKVQRKAPGARAGAAPTAGLGGVGAALAESFAMPKIDPDSISTRIGEAIEEAKARLLALFTGENSPFAPLVTAWEQDIKPQLDRLMITLFGGVVEGEPTEGLVQTFQNAALDINTALGNIQTKLGDMSLFVQEKVDLIKTKWDEFKLGLDELDIPGKMATFREEFDNGLTGALNFATTLEETLLPAIDSVTGFIDSMVLPILTNLSGILDTTLTLASNILAETWNLILLPAIEAVWQFIQVDVMPLFNSLAGLARDILAKAIEILTAAWENKLKPVLIVVADILETKIHYWLEKVVTITELVNKVWELLIKEIDENFIPVLEFLGEIVLATINNGLGSIRSKIKSIISKIDEFRKAIMEIEVPWWLQPGSPPPLAMGLADIAKQMDLIATRRIPALQAQMRSMDVMAPVGGRGNFTNSSYADQRQANFHIGNINTPMDQQTFEVMADRWWQEKATGRTF